MSKVLFIPLNTNHVLIFKDVAKTLNCDYEFLCHDKITEAGQYHTEDLLKKIDIPYRHFPDKINRSANNNLFLRIANFYNMKKGVKNILEKSEPDLIVLAIDNDPISQVFIKETKTRGITSLMIQEGMIRPYEYTLRKTYFSDYFYKLLSSVGIYLTYIKYGTGDCDSILVSGKRALNILKKRGVPEKRMFMVGQPKYDDFIIRTESFKPLENEKKIYLYATSTEVVKNGTNIRFLKKLIQSAGETGIYLIIKLHPRLSLNPEDIYEIVNMRKSDFFEIVKQGDDTFEILKRSDVLITVSSNVVLEALMMDKECIVADYIAGEFRLDYGKYDAVHHIENESEIIDVIKKSILYSKNVVNKRNLLEDELYKLDGKAGQRSSSFIERIICR